MYKRESQDMINVSANKLENIKWINSLKDTALKLKQRKTEIWVKFSSVQLLSHVWLFATPWTAARQASLSITNSWRLLKNLVHLLSNSEPLQKNDNVLINTIKFLINLMPQINIKTWGLKRFWKNYQICQLIFKSKHVISFK